METLEEIEKREIENTARIKDVIEYLKTNFKPEDKICYMDCVEGYKNDCTYVENNQLGTRFFYYASELKKRGEKELTDEEFKNWFPYVSENDVVMI